jgi:predicted ArsR family transcriptional regulator
MKRREDLAIPPLATLDDPVRRQIFDFVRRSGRPVSREAVAEQLGISRKLAAFHLDKMLDRGLLKSHYARPPGRSGPGAGRSAKYYEPSDREIQISIPERRYDLAGSLLADAVLSNEGDETARTTAFRVARDRGFALGDEVRHAKRLRPPGPERALAIATEVLEDHGFEPYRDETGVVALKNCPFHALAQTAPELMCNINQAFIDGMLRGLGNKTVEAVLACKPGDCCVTLRAPGTSSPSDAGIGSKQTPSDNRR